MKIYLSGELPIGPARRRGGLAIRLTGKQTLVARLTIVG